MEEISKKSKKSQMGQNPYINVLLLGEAGVGKSTFINSIMNYLQYKSFENAIRKGVIKLVPTSISVTNEQNQRIDISVGSDNDEIPDTGVTGTREVKTYIVPIPGRKLRLIDTPGIGDAGGVEQDNTNFDNILKYLLTLNELHAICVLMKPTTTRNNPSFEYCLKQILSRLEQSASRNIIFIFTNTRGSEYTSGDTLSCLRQIIEDIRSKPPHVSIPLDHNIFCLDNEAFKILAAIEQHIKFGQRTLTNATKSWNMSFDECNRLILYIIGNDSNKPLKPHQMSNTININDIRKLVVQYSQPFIDVCRLINDNIRVLTSHEIQLKQEGQNIDELKNKLYVPLVSLKTTSLERPILICTSQKCSTGVKVAHENQWTYPQRCHEPCYLKNVTTGYRADECEMMREGYCKVCNCHSSDHRHIYYLTESVNYKMIDKSVKDRVSDKKMVLQETQRVIKEINIRVQELISERDNIVKSAAKFAHFLQNNSLSPFTDTFPDRIAQLIIREQSLVDNADKKMITNLREMSLLYENTKQHLDKNVNSAQNIQNTVKGLYQMKHYGKTIKELFDKQKVARNWECSTSSVNVNPTGSGVNSPKLNVNRTVEQISNNQDGASGNNFQTFLTQENQHSDNSFGENGNPALYQKEKSRSPEIQYGKIPRDYSNEQSTENAYYGHDSFTNNNQTNQQYQSNEQQVGSQQRRVSMSSQNQQGTTVKELSSLYSKLPSQIMPMEVDYSDESSNTPSKREIASPRSQYCEKCGWSSQNQCYMKELNEPLQNDTQVYKTQSQNYNQYQNPPNEIPQRKNFRSFQSPNRRPPVGMSQYCENYEEDCHPQRENYRGFQTENYRPSVKNENPEYEQYYKKNRNTQRQNDSGFQTQTYRSSMRTQYCENSEDEQYYEEDRYPQKENYRGFQTENYRPSVRQQYTENPADKQHYKKESQNYKGFQTEIYRAPVRPQYNENAAQNQYHDEYRQNPRTPSSLPNQNRKSPGNQQHKSEQVQFY